MMDAGVERLQSKGKSKWTGKPFGSMFSCLVKLSLRRINARMNAVRLFYVSLALIGMIPAFAELRLPNLFGDHMVLQAGKEVAVWGWGTPGEKVTVRFGGREAKAVVDAKGGWSTDLPSMEKTVPRTQSSCPAM